MKISRYNFMKKSINMFLVCALFLFKNVLAMPCPTNSSIIYKGYTPEQVIKECGEPTFKNSFTKVVDVTQKWEYYKPHAYDNNNAKIEIVIKNNRASNITVTDIN